MKLLGVGKQLVPAASPRDLFRAFPTFVRSFTRPAEHSEEDFAKARKWYAELSESSALRNIGELSYSRSSGPGGQNVNK
jgi:protein subunit release factor B